MRKAVWAKVMALVQHGGDRTALAHMAWSAARAYVLEGGRGSLGASDAERARVGDRVGKEIAVKALLGYFPVREGEWLALDGNEPAVVLPAAAVDEEIADKYIETELQHLEERMSEILGISPLCTPARRPCHWRRSCSSSSPVISSTSLHGTIGWAVDPARPRRRLIA